jgi:hypothetical protein
MITVLLCAVTAAATWGLLRLNAAAKIARVQEEMLKEVERAHGRMRKEVAFWQDKAARENMRANQLERDATTWAAGCKQGRDDVISIVPLLIAVQDRQAGTSLPARTEEAS